MRRLRALVVAVAVSTVPILGCGGHSPPAPRLEREADLEAHARTFGTRLIDVLERDDLLGFRELLSARMQERKRSEAELLQMFTSWRSLLVPYAQALRDAEWTLAYNDADPRPQVRFRAIGRSPEALTRVVEEHGALRIDEN